MPCSMLASASTCKKGRLTHDTITGVSKHEPMLTNREETRMCITAITAILILLLLSLLCGCKARKVVTEYVVSHDTVMTYRKDTIRDVKYLHHTDTVTNKEVHTYTINDVGDTLKEIHHYHDTEKVIIVDSTDRYRAVVDSLQRIVDSQKEKKVEVTKMKVPMKWVAFILVTVLAIIVLVTRDKSN